MLMSRSVAEFVLYLSHSLQFYLFAHDPVRDNFDLQWWQYIDCEGGEGLAIAVVLEEQIASDEPDPI